MPDRKEEGEQPILGNLKQKTKVERPKRFWANIRLLGRRCNLKKERSMDSGWGGNVVKEFYGGFRLNSKGGTRSIEKHSEKTPMSRIGAIKHSKKKKTHGR